MVMLLEALLPSKSVMLKFQYTPVELIARLERCLKSNRETSRDKTLTLMSYRAQRKPCSLPRMNLFSLNGLRFLQGP